MSMIMLENCRYYITVLRNRIAARLSMLAKPPIGFVSQPEPRSIGDPARGRQMATGTLLFAGQSITAPDTNLWDIPVPDNDFTTAIQGCKWLDDLAAAGDGKARKTAQIWVWRWIKKYGRGGGPGWTPELAGQRLIRWLHHALFLLRGQDQAKTDLFLHSLAQQTIFLAKRAHAAPAGLPRLEAQVGLIYASLSLEGMAGFLQPALDALGEECSAQIDSHGGIATRNPEELLEIFKLLTWAKAALTDSEQIPTAELERALQRIAPSLRTLRHANGNLVRFQGGDQGMEGMLDTALAACGIKSRNSDGLTMGYARLSAGRTSVIIDAGPPATGNASYNAHASTLAFELTSGRRPLIVSCGSGAHLGPDWHRAGRATPSHSTLCLGGYSSARLGKPVKTSGLFREFLVEAPKIVPVEMSQTAEGVKFEGAHSGYVPPFGLTHARKLSLSLDGRSLVGEDLLIALNDTTGKAAETVLSEDIGPNVDFQIRFHLHPEVDAALDLGGTTVAIAAKSGEIWIFRHESSLFLTIEPGVYLEKNQPTPRASRQIVLSGMVNDALTRAQWSLSKTQDTAMAIRDLRLEELR